MRLLVRRPRGLLGALAHRDFRLLMLAFGISGAGSWAYNVGLSVYVYEQTRSPAWVGAVTIGRFVPSLLAGGYAGVVAERFERVRLMLRLDVAAAVLMGLLAVLAAAHGPALAAIALGAAASLVQSPYLPAVTAITPQLVGEDDLAAANTLRSTVDNLVVVVGPALGGLGLLVASPATVFAFNGATFLASAALLVRVRARSTPVDVTEGGSVGAWRQLLVGVVAMARSGSAMLLVGYAAVTSFLYGTDTVLFVALSEQRLGTGATGYGYLLAGLGVGGILAAGIVNRLARNRRLAFAILGGIAAYTLPSVALVAVREPAVAVVIEVVRGGGTLVVDVLAMTALQRAVAEEELGRVFGVFFTLVLISISLGALVAPILLREVGLDGALWAVGAGVPALCLLGWPALAAMDRRNAEMLGSIADRIGVLERAALLAEAPRAALERLAAASKELTIAPGVDVVVEGAIADALYVLIEGRVRVHARRGGEEDLDLAVLGGGDVFGEIGLLAGIARTATVSTLGSCTMLRVDGDVFVDALTAGLASSSLVGRAESRLGVPIRRQRVAAAAAARGAGAVSGEPPAL